MIFVIGHNKAIMRQIDKALPGKTYEKDRTFQAILEANRYLGQYITQDIKREIRSGAKTGKVYAYDRNGVRVLHQASAKGETPANLTGKLAASINFTIKDRRLQFGSKRGHRATYAKKLHEEMGRPFLTLAVHRNRNRILNSYIRFVQAHLERPVRGITSTNLNTQLERHIRRLRG